MLSTEAPVTTADVPSDPEGEQKPTESSTQSSSFSLSVSMGVSPGVTDDGHPVPTAIISARFVGFCAIFMAVTAVLSTLFLLIGRNKDR